MIKIRKHLSKFFQKVVSANGTALCGGELRHAAVGGVPHVVVDGVPGRQLLIVLGGDDFPV